MATARKKRKPARPVPMEIPRGVNTRPLKDMKLFHGRVDWRKWWEDFYLRINESGLPLYKSVRHFAHRRAKSPEQKEFLIWVLGPQKDLDSNIAKWPFAKPMDWDTKRDSGGWFGKESIKGLASTIRAKRDALESLREAGELTTLPMLVRLEQLAQQVDKAFSGSIFVEGLSISANYARANHYLGLLNKIINMKAKADDMYARAHGVNFDDMDGLSRLLAASMQSRIQESGKTPEQTRYESTMTALNEMMLKKAAKFDFELPKDAAKVLEMIPVNKKKNGIQ